MTEPELRHSIIEHLQAQSAPVSAATLAKTLPSRLPAKRVAAVLEALAAEGKAFALTQGQGTAYALRPPLDMCADALSDVVAVQTEAVQPAHLKAALRKELRPWFDEALGRLIVHGKARWLPLGKQRLVLNRTVRPSDLLSSAERRVLEKLLAGANRHRQTPRTLEQLLSWLDASDAAARSIAPGEQQLRDWYALDRAASSSSMIELPRTWARYEAWALSQSAVADIALFRDAIASMYDEGKAELEPCERPNDLKPHERELQVALSLGPPGYYWRPAGAE